MEQEQDGETIFSFSAANQEIGEAVSAGSAAIINSLVELIDSGWVKTATQDEINRRVAEIAGPYSESAKGAALTASNFESFARLDIGDGDEDVEMAKFYRMFAAALEQLVERDSPHPEVVDWTGPPEYFDDIASQIRAGRRQWRRFRTILAAFGYSRRRQTVVDEINRKLRVGGLRAKPELTTDLPLDKSVVFSLADPGTGEADRGGGEESPGVESGEIDEVEESEEEGEDLGPVIPLRVGNLEASERQPAYLSPDATVEEAMTILALGDCSQIVVRTGSHTVRGIVSYRSIAKAQHSGKVLSVADCLETDFRKVYLDDPLIDVVNMFQTHDTVLVLKKDQTLSGLVTPSDIASEFGAMAEPFFLIGEIENSLRWLVKRRGLNVPRLLAETLDESVAPVSVDRLTIGEMEHMLQSEEGWGQLGVPYDRKVFCRELEGVRESRNELMHFRGALTAGQVEKIRQFLSLLRRMCEDVEKEMGGTP